MTRRPDGIELVLLDRGKAVSPARIAAALDRPLEPGGLGVKLMKRCMDHFEYEKRAGGGARLVLRKRRGKPLKGRAPGKDLR
jgi:anti-sigma regulatory factor (Ser/Thr protein kinase)